MLSYAECQGGLQEVGELLLLLEHSYGVEVGPEAVGAQVSVLVVAGSPLGLNSDQRLHCGSSTLAVGCASVSVRC